MNNLTENKNNAGSVSASINNLTEVGKGKSEDRDTISNKKVQFMISIINIMIIQ